MRLTTIRFHLFAGAALALAAGCGAWRSADRSMLAVAALEPGRFEKIVLAEGFAKPMELEVFVGKCLAKDPADRYGNAGEIAKDLRTLAEKLKSGQSAILRTVNPEAGSPTTTAASQTGNPARAWLWPAVAAGFAIVARIRGNEDAISCSSNNQRSTVFSPENMTIGK